jgi:uncharacterized protein YbbC (DUF1343 family)
MNWKSASFSLINLAVGISLMLSSSCVSQTVENKSANVKNLGNDPIVSEVKRIDTVYAEVITGAAQTELYLPSLKNRKVGVVANNTSVINQTHIVDSLLSVGVDVKIVFSPEHGFRGDHDAGDKINHSVDEKTGLPIFSLHGNTKKPSSKSLKGIDVLLFDIQDVGVRFYTYISSLHYVMEACAENNIELILLDRPNPNAHYIGGPVLNEKYTSFVGMHPVPVVYGMSIGEYARMINGENWLKDSVVCDLKVVRLKNWTYNKEYILPIPPSPNLPTQLSIYLYPHICFFEGTSISVGRGTAAPFEKYGHPKYRDVNYSFTPQAVPGKSSNPPFKNEECFGVDLSGTTLVNARSVKNLKLSYLLNAKEKTATNNIFTHSSFFNLLAGNNELIQKINLGQSEREIQASWELDLSNFKKVRSKYLMYIESK